MPITWPTQLPAPNLDGYGLQNGEAMQRSELSSGRARQRRRFTSVPTVATVSWVMTQPQSQLFEAWYKYTLKDGAEWFEGKARTALGYGDYEMRFTGMYAGPVPFAFSDFRFEAQVEIRERQTLGESWVLFPDYIIESNIIDLAVNVEWPAA